MGGSSRSKRSQTVGHRYYLGMHLAICHGPVDAITEVQVAERQVWSGHLNTSGRLRINKPDIFGGDKREGGISGVVDIAFGEETQPSNDYLARHTGTPQPAFRGILGVILRQVYIAANNPYVKSWAIRLKRCFRGWYPEKAEITGGANPAHMIYECLTQREWGMGYASSIIDDASFRTAADTLYSEGFSLHMIWTQQSRIEEFVQKILDHIGGVLTTSPSTGRFELTLIRADYDVATLPVLDPNNVIAMESYQRAAWGETTNEIVVIYTRADTFRETSIAVQDLANVQAQGGVVSQTQRYPGITDDNLASRVAMRDLAAVSTPLAKVRLRVNRQAWRLRPGDVFNFVWPDLGIEGLAMRVADIDGGTLAKGAITIDAVEDVFGLPDASYTATQPVGWTDPVPEPVPVATRRIMEVPFWDIALTLSPAELDYLDETDSFVLTLAARPVAGAINYELYSKSASASGYTSKDIGEFCPIAILDEALIQEITTTVPYHSDQDMDLVEIGGYALVNDEVVQVTAMDTVNHTLTLVRGVLDTVPMAHPAGSLLWFADGVQGVDTTEYATGEMVYVKLLTATGKGTLVPEETPTDGIILTGRQNRPYPPGNVKINGARWPQTVSGDLKITWSHRNRLAQTVTLTSQTEGNIGPEPGVTCTLRIFGETDTLLREWTGLAGTNHTYTLAEEMTDSGFDRPNTHLRIELEASRDGVTSWQTHSIALERTDTSA